MPPQLPSALLLFFCWIAACGILLIFLESWFGVSGKNRFVGRRASGAYGICSVFIPMSGPADKMERTIRSVLGQSYPFLELFLLYSDEDDWMAALAQEFRAVRSHISVRLVPVAHSVSGPYDRIRALEHIQASAKGRWYVIVDPDVVLDRFAIEASMEFAASGELSALALRPGTQCAFTMQRLLAPSMEYLFQTMRVVERRRERAKKMNLDSSFLLVNRESFEVVNRMNRMPGILNESGWNVWSYQAEGLRTFEGDGSRWIWREIGLGAWPEQAGTDWKYRPRTAAFIVAATLVSLIPMAGLAYGFLVPIATFLEASILAFSAVGYALMAISYYLYARRLHAATWFAPLWFLAQPVASLLTFVHLQRRAAGREKSSEGAADPSLQEGWTRRSK